MKKRILIVDDEASIVDNITFALETEGFIHHWSENASAALDVLQSQDFDFIILDVGLPDKNGFDLFKEIQKLYDIPVMFLTARDDVVDRVVGLELGADDYLVKPFSPRELTARIKTILRRSNQSTDHASGESRTKNGDCKVGPFIHQEAQKCISLDDTTLILSRYEYLLLEHFLSNPNKVYSRGQLMETIWDVPESSLDRTVDAHVKNIRAKIKAVMPDYDPLVTHRGLGYSFKVER